MSRKVKGNQGLTNNGRSPEQIENDENCNFSNALSNYQLSTGLDEISFYGVLYGVYMGFVGLGFR